MPPQAGPDCTLSGSPPYNCQGCNLSGRALAGKDLTGAQLQGATLTGTSFKGVLGMARANLTGAVMGNGTDFSGCDLSATIFGPHPTFGTDAAHPTLLVGATVSYEVLGLTWSYLDLTGATIVNLPQDLTWLEVMESNLTGIDFTGRSLKNAHFYGVALSRAKFDRATLNNVVFARGQEVCDLTDATFTGATIPAGVFDTSTLTRTDFTGATLAGASFLQTRMDGTRFDRTDVTACSFSAPPRFSRDPANLTSFRGARLNYATVAKQWSYLDLTGATLVGLGPSTDLTYLQALYTVLTGWDLSGYTMDQANLTGATLTGTRFAGASLNSALLYGVQNPCELFRVPKASADYATALSALQRTSGAEVAQVFARYGHPISATRSTVKTDDPNRWWTVTDAGSHAVYPVVSASSPEACLIVMDMSLVTRFDGAKLRGANFSPNGTQPARLRGVVFSGAPMDGADCSLADFGQVNPYAPGTAAQFKGASMNGVGLSQAMLTGAQLTGTVYLHDADLTGATLKGADLTGAQLGELAEAFRVPQASSHYQELLTALPAQNAGVVSTIFGEYQHPIAVGQIAIAVVVANRSWTVTDGATQTVYTVLNWTSTDQATFLIVFTPTKAATLTGAYMPGASLVDANLYGVSAAHVSLYGSEVHLDGAILDNCVLPRANLGASSVIVKALYEVDLSDANLINATLKGADLTGGVTLSYANLQGTDFTNTEMNGVNLANAAVAIDLAPSIAGVYLFGLGPADPDYQPALAELQAGISQVNIAPDPATIPQYITYLNDGDLADLRAAFQQAGVTFSSQARIEPTGDTAAWQVIDATPPGTYTVWHGFDDLGAEGLLARPSLPVLRQVFQANPAVAGTLRWQASLSPGPAAGQWIIDNDSENPKNLQLGYATLLAAKDPDGSLAFYGTTLRIQQLGDGNQLQIRTVSYTATVLCPEDNRGGQQCHDDGSTSFFGPDTVCPNTRTVSQNQGSSNPVPWAMMLRAPAPPAPPTCVPSPYADCPQASAATIAREARRRP